VGDIGIPHEKQSLANYGKYEIFINLNDIFITFEEIEVCGKSTQPNMLVNWLRDNG
jgi:hypothetical protein